MFQALNKIDEEEFTPLQIAYKQGNLEVLDLFLQINPLCGRTNSKTLFKIISINARYNFILNFGFISNEASVGF